MEQYNIQWFPGHMKKTERLIKDNISLVDLVVELIDSRAPISSQNPMLNNLIKSKPRILLLAKSDLSDSNANRQWIKHFKDKDIPAMLVDCKNKKIVKNVVHLIRETLADLIALRSQKGISGKIIRIMVVGIPNVGKSTFINSLAGRYKAKTEDRPGVTMDKQWIHVDGNIDLLDTPGTLWPKFDNLLIGLHLAFIGSIKDDVYDVEYIAMQLLDYLSKNYPDLLKERFKIEFADNKEPYEKLEDLGRARGMIIKGGEIDTLRAANALLFEYRSGKLGRITLEMPNDDIIY